MRRRPPASASIAAAVMLTLSTFALAEGFDPFSVRQNIASSPAKSMIPMETAEGDPCRFTQLGVPLSLVETVERALCHNPQTRQAWATAKLQAATLGVAQAAYLPTISATLGVSKQKNSTRYPDFSVLNSKASPTIRSAGLKMSLVLSDFGLRSANVDQARALLESANATHDASLQGVFVSAAQAYFDTLSALAVLDASLEAETAAKESFMAAEAKYKASVGTLTDKLQAQTAYSKTRLDRVKAEGAVKNAQGMLATTMGLAANTPVVLARHNGKLPDNPFIKPIDELIDEAKQHHPSLLAAQAQLNAAQASIKATRAEGLPTVSFASEISHSDQLGQPLAVGYAPTDIRTMNKSIGVQVNIPLFEGFGRSYRVQSALGQAEVKAAELAKMEQQVIFEVWKSYQQLSTEAENIKATDSLVQSARESFNVARGRYKAGVGNMLELLNAQSALANAEQQRIISVSSWHTARLKLAASIGKIGLWAIQ